MVAAKPIISQVDDNPYYRAAAGLGGEDVIGYRAHLKRDSAHVKRNGAHPPRNGVADSYYFIPGTAMEIAEMECPVYMPMRHTPTGTAIRSFALHASVDAKENKLLPESREAQFILGLQEAAAVSVKGGSAGRKNGYFQSLAYGSPVQGKIEGFAERLAAQAVEHGILSEDKKDGFREGLKEVAGRTFFLNGAEQLPPDFRSAAQRRQIEGSARNNH